MMNVFIRINFFKVHFGFWLCPIQEEKYNFIGLSIYFENIC